MPAPSQRKSMQYQSRDNFRCGFHAKSRPPEEIAAMLAQDIQGMGEEIAALRDLGRLLIEMQRQAVDAAELASLIDMYSLSAVRLGEMVRAQ